MAEHVRQVAHTHRPAQRLRPGPPELEVPDDGLARDEELVHQDLPRPDRETVLGDQPPDQGFGLGPDLEVVVDRGGLAVEREAPPLVGRHPLEQLVDQLDEAQPEHLERLVPLPVPMGVRDQVDDRGLGHPAASPPMARPNRAA